MRRLSPLQRQVLVLLAPMSPRWTLTGGAALAGFHCGHRTTRDLDLFWHGSRALDDQEREVARLLDRAGLRVVALQRSESFVRLQVSSTAESVVVDCVAEPVRCAEPPREVQLDGVTIQVDTPHEILTNKLGALLHRHEPRDLLDIRTLVEGGGDLGRALADAARKDGGFSPLTLAWSLEGFDLQNRARTLGMPEEEVQGLEGFRLRLRDELVRLTRP
jgi:hypothetical protein